MIYLMLIFTPSRMSVYCATIMRHHRRWLWVWFVLFAALHSASNRQSLSSIWLEIYTCVPLGFIDPRRCVEFYVKCQWPQFCFFEGGEKALHYYGHAGLGCRTVPQYCADRISRVKNIPHDFPPEPPRPKFSSNSFTPPRRRLRAPAVQYRSSQSNGYGYTQQQGGYGAMSSNRGYGGGYDASFHQNSRESRGYPQQQSSGYPQQRSSGYSTNSRSYPPAAVPSGYGQQYQNRERRGYGYTPYNEGYQRQVMYGQYEQDGYGAPPRSYRYGSNHTYANSTTSGPPAPAPTTAANVVVQAEQDEDCSDEENDIVKTASQEFVPLFFNHMLNMVHEAARSSLSSESEDGGFRFQTRDFDDYDYSSSIDYSSEGESTDMFQAMSTKLTSNQLLSFGLERDNGLITEEGVTLQLSQNYSDYLIALQTASRLEDMEVFKLLLLEENIQQVRSAVDVFEFTSATSAALKRAWNAHWNSAIRNARLVVLEVLRQQAQERFDNVSGEMNVIFTARVLAEGRHAKESIRRDLTKRLVNVYKKQAKRKARDSANRLERVIARRMGLLNRT